MFNKITTIPDPHTKEVLENGSVCVKTKTERSQIKIIKKIVQEYLIVINFLHIIMFANFFLVFLILDINGNIANVIQIEYDIITKTINQKSSEIFELEIITIKVK